MDRLATLSRMVAVMLFMLVGGIAFSQVVSDPRAVTLAWLRLGGITSVTLLAIIGAAFTRYGASHAITAIWVGTLVAGIAQLVTAQLGKRSVQRVFALVVFVSSAVCVAWLAIDLFALDVDLNGGVGSGVPVGQSGNADLLRNIGLAGTAPIASALVGGFIMTMLLGHAYLTAGGEMTQSPFRRLVLWMGVMLIARMLLSAIFGLVMLMQSDDGIGSLGIWKGSILTARFAVGFVVPAIFTWMIYDCVKRRANQSATGILYVATLLVVIGEWAAVSLWESTGWIF